MIIGIFAILSPMKTFVIVLVAIIISLSVGYWFGSTPTYSPAVDEDTTSENLNSEAASSTATTTSASASDEGVTEISADALTDDQKQMLERFGIDTETITITPEMIQCAEAAIGKDRLDEIKNGDTPSFLESVSLLRCY
jgi:hypothetical protein